jgi:hypothetical protein
VNRVTATTIRQLELELEKAEHGLQWRALTS